MQPLHYKLRCIATQLQQTKNKIRCHVLFFSRLYIRFFRINIKYNNKTLNIFKFLNFIIIIQIKLHCKSFFDRFFLNFLYEFFFPSRNEWFDLFSFKWYIKFQYIYFDLLYFVYGGSKMSKTRF